MTVRTSSASNGPDPPFNSPTQAVSSDSGDIFVADGYGNARVHRFSSTGEQVSSWGEPGDGPGQFVLPHALVIDGRGRVLVADRENGRIQIFTQDGEFIEAWTGVQVPQDMAIDGDGNLFMADGDHMVTIWDLDGNLLAEWGREDGRSNDAGLFMVPHGIAVDSRGVLYVGEVCDTAPASIEDRAPSKSSSLRVVRRRIRHLPRRDSTCVMSNPDLHSTWKISLPILRQSGSTMKRLLGDATPCVVRGSGNAIPRAEPGPMPGPASHERTPHSHRIRPRQRRSNRSIRMWRATSRPRSRLAAEPRGRSQGADRAAPVFDSVGGLLH